MTLPDGRDGLSAQRIAAWCTLREPSLCRHVHREFMRNVLLDLTPILPVTACHQRHDVETYSRSIVAWALPVSIPLGTVGHTGNSPPALVPFDVRRAHEQSFLDVTAV